VRNHQRYRADIHTYGDWPGALLGAITSEPNQSFAIQFRSSQSAKFTLEHFKNSAFGAARWLAHLIDVIDMKIDRIAKRFPAPGTLADG
jgi:hypothetical protein